MPQHWRFSASSTEKDLKNADQSVVDAPGLGALAAAHMAFLHDEGTDVELPL